MSIPTYDPLDGFRRPLDPRDPRALSLFEQGGAGEDGKWAVIGLPYDGGIPSRPGARFGPEALRKALLTFTTDDGDSTLPSVADFGDLGVEGIPGAVVHQRIEETAERAFSAPARPLFIGGDHGCTGSILRGFAASRPAARLGIVSLDAHLDVREYEEQGAISSGTPFRRALETDVVRGEHVVMIGIRPFANSTYYREWARDRGVRVVTVEEVAERGASEIAEAVLASLVDVDTIYLSVDLDVADAAFAPGVSAPGIGGLTSREVIALTGAFAADSRLAGADIMELSPPYDLDGRTARLAARLLLEVLRRSGTGGHGG